MCSPLWNTKLIAHVAARSDDSLFVLQVTEYDFTPEGQHVTKMDSILLNGKARVVADVYLWVARLYMCL